MPKITTKEADLIGASAQLIILKLGAGLTRQVPGYGNRYYCKELYNATTNNGVADIQIQTDATSKRPLNVGIGEHVPEGSYFTVLTLFNPLAVDVYVELYSGFGDIIDNRLNIVRERPAYNQPVTDAPTDVIALPAAVADANTLAAGDTWLLSTTPPTGYSQRRGFTIANADPNLPVQIVDANGDVISLVFAESPHVYYVSGAVGIKNANASGLAVYVGEIWYSNYTP